VARQALFGNGGGHGVAVTSRCASRSTATRFRCSLTCTYGAAEDTSLQFAYGLALLRSGRPREAAPILEALLAAQPSDELTALVREARELMGGR